MLYTSFVLTLEYDTVKSLHIVSSCLKQISGLTGWGQMSSGQPWIPDFWPSSSSCLLISLRQDFRHIFPNILFSKLSVGCSELFFFSCSVMSDSLCPHGLQDCRLPCLSTSPRVCSNSCPSSWWFHTTISSSVISFFSCLQTFLASGAIPMSWLFISCGHNIGASSAASVLPMNIQDWFPLGLTDLIS